jgi:hypothetical protein
MQKILKWFAPAIAFGVAIFIILFLISINPSQESDNYEALKDNSGLVQEKSKKVWLNHFSKSQRLGYFYPVNEVFVKVDLNEKVKDKTTYKLLASLLDPYQLFCLKEELDRYKLRYYLKRDKNSVELLIYSKNKQKLKSLVKVLKKYKISAKITLQKAD